MLNGKNIIVTGCLGRIGFATTLSLIKNGYNVLGIDNKIDKSREKKIRNLKQNSFEFKKVNLINEKNINLFFKNIESYKNSFQGFINCAYPTLAQGMHNEKKYSFKKLKKNIDNQLTFTIYLTQRMISYFVKRKSGKIILISSIQGISAPKFSHYKNTNMDSPVEYSASKAAIISVTKYFAKKYGKVININCISPGGIDDNQKSIFKKRYKASCLKKGLLQPEDLSGAIIFLLSQSSISLNGQNLIIDDGWSL